MTFIASKRNSGASVIPHVAGLASEFLWRELRTRFAGSISGGLWAVFQPLIQLGVYYFAFVFIFKVSVPGENPPGYLSFLAAGMWPWFAFSEAVVRATTVIHENAALIGKVAVPRAVLVFASVAASFLIHLTGFVFIIAVLAFATNDIDLVGIIPALLLMLPLFVFGLGLALLLSAVQVFIRDLAQVLSQLMTMLMFAARNAPHGTGRSCCRCSVGVGRHRPGSARALCHRCRRGLVPARSRPAGGAQGWAPAKGAPGPGWLQSAGQPEL